MQSAQQAMNTYSNLAYAQPERYARPGTYAPPRVEPQRRRVHEPAVQPSEETQARVNARAQARTRAREATRVRVPGFAILGGLVVLMMAVFVLTSIIQLNSVNAEIVSLEGQMTTLRADAARLRIEHENAFALVEVERFAREELGMVEPVPGQVVLIQANARDTAEILFVEYEQRTGFFQHIADLFASLREYFPF